MTADFDTLLTSLGEFGRYQKTRFYALCVPAAFLCSWAFSVLIFAMRTPEHHCALPPEFTFSNENLTKRFLDILVPKVTLYGVNTTDSCNLLLPVGIDLSRFEDIMAFASHPESYELENITGAGCPWGWEYDKTDWDENIVTKWDLVCDRTWIINLIFMLQNIGNILGILLFSFLLDRFGRRPPFFVGLTFFIIPGLLYMFMPNWQSLAVLVLLKSFAGSACFEIPWLMAIELVGPTRHTMVVLWMCVAFAFACFVYAGIAYVCRTWIQLVVASTLPAALLYSYYFILDESGRWLVATGRLQKARELLKKIARINGAKLELETLTALRVTPKISISGKDHVETGNQYGFWTLFSYSWNLFGKTVAISYIYGVNLIIYYGLNINVEHLGGNQYLVYAIQALVEIPAYICILICDRYGRIFPMCVMLMVSGICNFTAALMPYGATAATIAFAIGAKFAIAFTFAIIYMMAGELFPTVIRASGVGFAGFTASIMNIPTPYIIYAVHLHKSIPMGIFGLLALVAGVVGLFLPETMGSHLNETLVDGERQKCGIQALKDNVTCQAVKRGKARFRRESLLSAVGLNESSIADNSWAKK